MIRLQDGPIHVEEAIAAVSRARDGAVAVFVGTVREVNEGRRVRDLEYVAYAEMAVPAMKRIVDDAVARFGVSRVALVHRTGRLDVGETSVVVAVAAPHRADALDACRWTIDELKRAVPIWKRERFDGGAVWIEGSETTRAAED